MPWVTVVTDSFTRANETPLTTPWATGSGESGFNLTSNAANSPDDSNDRSSIYTARTWRDDQSSKAKLTTSGNGGGNQGVGLAVRHAPAARTYYRLICDHAASNNIAIHRMLAGAQTVLVQFTRSWTDGATWELQVSGPASAALLEVFHNGTSVQSFTDNSSLASGIPGLSYSTASISGTVDDWEGGELIPTLEYDYSKFPKSKLRRRDL